MSYITCQEKKEQFCHPIKESIKHVVVECGALAITRERHFKTDNKRDIFENVHIDAVLS